PAPSAPPLPEGERIKTPAPARCALQSSPLRGEVPSEARRSGPAKAVLRNRDTFLSCRSLAEERRCRRTRTSWKQHFRRPAPAPAAPPLPEGERIKTPAPARSALQPSPLREECPSEGRRSGPAKAVSRSRDTLLSCRSLADE